MNHFHFLGRNNLQPLAGSFAVAVLIILTASACREQVEKASEIPQPKIEGDKITLPDGSTDTSLLSVQKVGAPKASPIHLTGRLVWNDDLTVRIYSPVAGRVSEIAVKPGQSIDANGILAKINSPDFGQALADSRTADANLRLSEKNLSRTRELFDHGAAARKDVENAEAAFAAANSERTRALAKLSLYSGSDSSTDDLYLLKSPLAGVVVERNITPGQEIRADQMLANAVQFYAPLFVVSDPAHVWIQLDVSESDAPLMRAGAKLLVHSKSFPDKVFEGVLENISDSLDATTRTIRVRGSVDNSSRLLKAEMYVSVDVIRTDDNTIANEIEVASKAVFTKDNKNYIFVQTGTGVFERKSVTVGRESDDKAIILTGVTFGEDVVVEGSLLLESMLESAGKP